MKSDFSKWRPSKIAIKKATELYSQSEDQQVKIMIPNYLNSSTVEKLNDQDYLNYAKARFLFYLRN